MKKLKAFVAFTLSILVSVDSISAVPVSSPVASFSFSIPASLGFISETHSASADTRTPDVILIQNLHANRSVQFAISGILKRLKMQGLMPDAIAVEGETGPVEIEPMQLTPDPKLRKKAANYLVEQGEMPGAMHFVVTEGEGRLFGIETHEYYQANLEMFRRSYSNRTDLRKEIEAIEAVLPTLKKDTAVREQVATLEKDLQVVHQLITNQVIPAELPATLRRVRTALNQVKEILPAQSADQLMESLSASINFYALAMLRDEELFKNTLAVRQLGRQKTSIVVTGGFHTEAMAELFKQKGLSYAVVTPNVKKHDRVDENLYVERLLDHHLTPEQVATGIDWASQGSAAPSATLLEFMQRAMSLWPASLRQARLPRLKIAGRWAAVALTVAIGFGQQFIPVHAQQRGTAQPSGQGAPPRPFRTIQDAADFVIAQRAMGGKGLPATFWVGPNAQFVNEDVERIVKEGVGLYDTALAIIALVEAGRIEAAQQIVDIYAQASQREGRYGNMELRALPSGDNMGAFQPFSRSAHFFFNFTRANGQWGPEWRYWNAHTGPNAWLATAIARLIPRSGASANRNIAVLRTLGDAMILMQTPDKRVDPLGGVRYGPLDQFFEPGPSSSEPYFTVNTENVVSAFAAFNHIFNVTKDPKYSQAAQKLVVWLSETPVYNPQTKQMQKGLFDPKTSTVYVGARYVQASKRWEIEPLVATDSGGTWTISALGPELVDKLWGKGAAYRMYMSLRANSGRTATFDNAGMDLPIAGFDFNGRFPASQGLITPEWSAGGRRAIWRLLAFYRDGTGKGIITPEQIAGLERDDKTIQAGIAQEPNRYARGPGMNPPRNGATGWGWFSSPGEAAMASVYDTFPFDPLAAPLSFTTVAAVLPLPAPAPVPAPAPAPTPSPTGAGASATPGAGGATQATAPQGDVEVLAPFAGGPFVGTIGDYAVWADGNFNLPSGTRIRIIFPVSQAGTRFRLRLLPSGGNAGSPTGLNRSPFTIPANGIVEIPIRAADFGLSEQQLGNLSQISVHSGANGFGPLNQGADRRAAFDRIERVGSAAAPAGQPQREVAPAPQPGRGTAATPQLNEGVLIASQATQFYDDGTAHSSGVDNPDDLSRFRSLIFRFDPSQAGTRFMVRIVPQGASFDGQTGLNRTIYTVGPNGITVVPLDPALYGLTAAQLRNARQLALSSGSRPWGQFDLKQPGSRHADFIEVLGSDRVVPKQGASLKGTAASLLMAVVGLAVALGALGYMVMPESGHAFVSTVSEGPIPMSDLLSHVSGLAPEAALAFTVVGIIFGGVQGWRRSRELTRTVSARVRNGLLNVGRRIAAVPVDLGVMAVQTFPWMDKLLTEREKQRLKQLYLRIAA